MSVNKNFVVKNGLEVNTKLILADSSTNKVGIGSTVPRTQLDVRGGIAGTDLYITGVATVLDHLHVGPNGEVFTTLGIGGSVGVGTNLPAYLFEIHSPVSTGQSALYVRGDARITGNVYATDAELDDLTLNNVTVNRQTTTNLFRNTGFSTITSLYVENDATIFVGIVTHLSGTNVNYSGIGTVNNLRGTNLNYTGVGTIPVLSGTNLNYTGISTIDSLKGTSLNYAGISTLSHVTGTNVNYSGIGTIQTLDTTSATIDYLTGTASTIGSVQIASGIVTATQFVGDGSRLSGIATGLTATIGIQSGGIVIGAGVTTVNVVGGGTTLNIEGTTANVYLPPRGVSLGLAIALGG